MKRSVQGRWDLNGFVVSMTTAWWPTACRACAWD